MNVKEIKLVLDQLPQETEVLLDDGEETYYDCYGPYVLTNMKTGHTYLALVRDSVMDELDLEPHPAFE